MATLADPDRKVFRGDLADAADADLPLRGLVIADDIGVFLPIARSLGRAGITVDVATSP